MLIRIIINPLLQVNPNLQVNRSPLVHIICIRNNRNILQINTNIYNNHNNSLNNILRIISRLFWRSIMLYLYIMGLRHFHLGCVNWKGIFKLLITMIIRLFFSLNLNYLVTLQCGLTLMTINLLYTYTLLTQL